MFLDVVNEHAPTSKLDASNEVIHWSPMKLDSL